MIRIFYQRGERHCSDTFSDPAELAPRLEQLWKSRIEATAYDYRGGKRGEIIGQVCRELFANLIWWCESVDYFASADAPA